MQFNCDPPNANNIRRWHKQLATTGCLCKGKSVGQPRVSKENVDFFLWGFIKDRVYVPPFPANLPELKERRISLQVRCVLSNKRGSH
ncbi:hypothetical protein C0J52_21838 [Blattella germanica]|nr:hypothetical protein C0J52_21838 [Blattella germanica]